MADWKEEAIKEYHILERGKQMVEEEMIKNPAISKLRFQIKDAQQELTEREREYKEDVHNCDLEMQTIRDDLVKRWDIEGKSFKCDKGSATLRTTRALKVKDKVKLISSLLRIGKLTQCIKGWDLAYLRKLADADIFNVTTGDIIYYDEKRNIVISTVKNGGTGKDDK